MEHFFVYTKIRRLVLERKCYFCAGLSQSTNRNNQTNQQRNKQRQKKKTYPVHCWLLKHSGTDTGTTNRLTERNSRCRCEPWDFQQLVEGSTIQYEMFRAFGICKKIKICRLSLPYTIHQKYLWWQELGKMGTVLEEQSSGSMIF